MVNRTPSYFVVLSIFLPLCLLACSKGKTSNEIKIADEKYVVTVPKGLDFQCKIIPYAANCKNFGLIDMSDTDAKICTAETKSTEFTIVIQKQSEKNIRNGSNDPGADMTGAWTDCKDARIIDRKTVKVDGDTAIDSVLTSPLGKGAARSIVNKDISLLSFALPRMGGENSQEIASFSSSMRPANGK